MTDVAFILPLSPEEAEPTMGEAVYLRNLFLEMRAPLRGSGLRMGIDQGRWLMPDDQRTARSGVCRGVSRSHACEIS